MKLGTYVEMVNFVNDADDLNAAGEYYLKLGLKSVVNDVYTDGRYHLRLEQGEGKTPTLRYYGSDKNETLTSPEGVQIETRTDEPPMMLPHDDVTVAPDTTRLGKFGELSVFVNDLEVEGAFWEKHGYKVLGNKHSDPMPWGIWTDDLFLIGIHQYGMEEPFSITHFDPNMKDINKALMEEGFELVPFMEDNSKEGEIEHATLMSPYGLKFYLFTGDISKANP